MGGEQMSDNRPARYEENGRVIYRASSLGLCDKVFVALAQGYDPKAHPAWFQEILDEGTRNEEVIRHMYQNKTGLTVEGVGNVLEMEITDGVWLRGSIDGWVEGNLPLAIWDAKKIRDSGWARYLRSGVEFQANYPFQFSAYMHMWEAMFGKAPEFVMCGGHYEQDKKTGEWSITETVEHIYDTPMVNLRALKKRIINLENLIDKEKPIGDVQCTKTMYPCPFYYLHDDDDQDEPPVRPSDDIVKPLLLEWAELDQQAEPMKVAAAGLTKIQKRQKELQDGIMAWMQAGGQESGKVSTVDVGEVEVAMKYLVSPRKGYTVEPGETTRVTIVATKRDGEATGNKAPKDSRGGARPKPPAPRKALPPKPNTEGLD
jgi:hypothetical protein